MGLGRLLLIIRGFLLLHHAKQHHPSNVLRFCVSSFWFSLGNRQSKVGVCVERDRNTQRNVQVPLSGPVVDHGLEVRGQCELGITMASIRQPAFQLPIDVHVVNWPCRGPSRLVSTLPALREYWLHHWCLSTRLIRCWGRPADRWLVWSRGSRNVSLDGPTRLVWCGPSWSSCNRICRFRVSVISSCWLPTVTSSTTVTSDTSTTTSSTCQITLPLHQENWARKILLSCCYRCRQVAGTLVRVYAMQRDFKLG
mmetsp:Transcript_138099/g.240076  ORF Transcript_138099/g.240076 Transcript_138099/m.240076 type:complete len:253 (-) Transcript_138099:3-761(-)